MQQAFPTSSREELNRKLNSVRSITLCKTIQETKYISNIFFPYFPQKISFILYFLQVLGNLNICFQSHQYSCYLMGFPS